jgi:ABC-type molybdate transport system substrate-binding protein
MPSLAPARRTAPAELSEATSDAPVRLLAAGSLKAAFSEAADEHRRRTGATIACGFGAAGLLRRRIAAGEAADIFASANMEHPQALAAPKQLPVRAFASNRLCALVAANIGATPENLLDRLLDPAVRLGISTPKADPSGDYAFRLFDKAELVQPRAGKRLKAKARQLTGAPGSPRPPQNKSVYVWLLQTGQVDIFLTYRTNAAAACAEASGLRLVELPPALAVEAEYGLVVLTSNARAAAFADFILGAHGLGILAAHGFAAPHPALTGATT